MIDLLEYKNDKYITFGDIMLKYNLSNKGLKKIEILISKDFFEYVKSKTDENPSVLYIYFNQNWNKVEILEIKIFENVHRFNGFFEMDIIFKSFENIGLDVLRDIRISKILQK